MARFDLLMLDWDGTLINSLPIKIDNAAALFAATFDADPLAVKRSYSSHSGIPRRDLFDAIARDCIGRAIDDDQFDQLSARFTSENREQISKKAKLRPGVSETLKVLSQSSVSMYISTSAAQQEVEPLVRTFGIAGYFVKILGSSPGFSKGEDHVALACDECGTTRERTAGLGDDILDIDLFSKAAITPFGITGTRSREELEERGAADVIDRIEDLLKLMSIAS